MPPLPLTTCTSRLSHSSSLIPFSLPMHTPPPPPPPHSLSLTPSVHRPFLPRLHAKHTLASSSRGPSDTTKTSCLAWMWSVSIPRFPSAFFCCSSSSGLSHSLEKVRPALPSPLLSSPLCLSQHTKRTLLSIRHTISSNYKREKRKEHNRMIAQPHYWPILQWSDRSRKQKAGPDNRK